MDGYDPATDPWWYPDDCPGEATPFAAAAAGDDEFLDIEGLLGLAWEGAALEPPQASAAALPPSEDMMAAWLYPIVSGEDNAGDGPMLKSEPSTMAMGMTESKRKLRATDGMHDVKVHVSFLCPVASARASPSGRGPAPLPTCASAAHQRRRLSPSPPPRKRPAPPLLASPPWRRRAVAAHLRSHHGHTLAMLTSAAATVSHLLLPPVAASHLRRRFGRPPAARS
ncbi:hypothetical protein ZWY2020_035315 [Hordeum vulgare]|nr:hypothetical protein ZWY2020_035315 [Hordeum vulgare]